MAKTIIAHRGLVRGPDKALENHPSQVEKALAEGFEVEVDVWFKVVPDHRSHGLPRPSWWLGHDGPQYEVSESFLTRQGLWLHCKDAATLERMTPDMHHFWHENDAYTITSKGYVWSYPGSDVVARPSVVVMPEWKIDPEYDIGLALGEMFDRPNVTMMCTDYGAIILESLTKRHKENRMREAAEVMSK